MFCGKFQASWQTWLRSSLWLWPVSSCISCLAGRREWMFSEHLRRVCYQTLGLLRTCLWSHQLESCQSHPDSFPGQSYPWNGILDFSLKSEFMTLLAVYPLLEEVGKEDNFCLLLGSHWKSCPPSRPNSRPIPSFSLPCPCQTLSTSRPSPHSVGSRCSQWPLLSTEILFISFMKCNLCTPQFSHLTCAIQWILVDPHSFNLYLSKRYEVQSNNYSYLI